MTIPSPSNSAPPYVENSGVKRRLLLMLFIAAALWRVVMLAFYRMVETDSSYYGAAARFFAEGYWEKALDPSWPPLFPFFTSLPYRLGAPLEASGIAVSLLAGALVIFPVYYIGRRIAGAGVGFTAAVIAAFHPRLIILSQSYLAESVYILFSASALAVFLTGLFGEGGLHGARRVLQAGPAAGDAVGPAARDFVGPAAECSILPHALQQQPRRRAFPAGASRPAASRPGSSRQASMFFLTGFFISLAFLARPEGFAYFLMMVLLLAAVLAGRYVSARFGGSDAIIPGGFPGAAHGHPFTGILRSTLLIAALVAGFVPAAAPYLYNVHNIEGKWMVGEKAGLSFYFTYMKEYAREDIDIETSDYASITGPNEIRKPGRYHTGEFLRRRPGTVIAHTMRNIPRVLFSKIPGLMYWPLYLLSLYGMIFRRKGRRSRAEMLLGAWVLLAVLMISPLFLFRRYFAVALAPLIIWAAIGADEIRRSMSKRSFAVVSGALIAALMVYSGVTLNRQNRPVLYKQAGLWLRENACGAVWAGRAGQAGRIRRDSRAARGGRTGRVVISGRKPEPSFYAECEYRPLEAKSMDALRPFLERKDVTHVVIDDYIMDKTHPRLMGLLQTDDAPSWLENVFSVSDDGHNVRVFRFIRTRPENFLDGFGR